MHSDGLYSVLSEAFYFASRAEEASDVQGEQARIQGQRNSFLMSLLILSAAIIRVDRKASYEEIIKLKDFFGRNFGPQAAEDEADMISHTLHHLQRVRDLCIHRVLKDLQEDRKTEKLSQNRTILSILVKFF